MKEKTPELSTQVNYTLQCNSYFYMKLQMGKAIHKIPETRGLSQSCLKTIEHMLGSPCPRCGLVWVSTEASKEEKPRRRWGHGRREPGLNGTCRSSPSSHGEWSKLTLSACKTLRPLTLKNSRLHCVSQLRCSAQICEGSHIISVSRGGAVGYPSCLFVRTAPEAGPNRNCCLLRAAKPLLSSSLTANPSP